MGERNPLLKYLQAAGLQATELFETDEVKIIDIVDDEFIDITDEAEEYFVKDSAIISMLMTMLETKKFSLSPFLSPKSVWPCNILVRNPKRILRNS